MKRFICLSLLVALISLFFAFQAFGGRRELIEKRTQTSKTFDNGNGTYTAEISNVPIHYQNALGKWQEIPKVLSNLDYLELTPPEDNNHSGDLVHNYMNGTYSWVGSSGFSVGYFFVPSILYQVHRGLLQWDLTPIPSCSPILSVGLRLHIFDSRRDQINLDLYAFYAGQGDILYWKDHPFDFWNRIGSPYYCPWVTWVPNLSSYPERDISWSYFRVDRLVEDIVYYSRYYGYNYFTMAFVRHDETNGFHYLDFNAFDSRWTKAALLVSYYTEPPNTPPNFQAMLRWTLSGPGSPYVVDTRWDQPPTPCCNQYPNPDEWVKRIYDFPRNQTPLYDGPFSFGPGSWTDNEPGLGGSTTRYSVFGKDRMGHDGAESPPVDVRLPSAGDPVIAHSSDSLATSYPNGKKIAVDNKGNIHIVFSSGDSVYYLSSKDKAKQWSVPALIGLGKHPAISLDASARPVVCWVSGTQILMSRYQDGWSPPRTVYSQPLLTSVEPPSFVMKGDTAFASWTDISPESANIQLSSFLPSDSTSPVVVTTVDRGTSTSFASPALAVDRTGKLYLAWSREGEVYQEDRGGLRMNLSETPGKQSLHPIVDAYGDRLCVTWQEESPTGGFDIVERTRTAGAWDGVRSIFHSGEHSSSLPDVVGASQFVWITKWGEDEEIYRLGRYEDGWVLESQNLSNTLTASRYPSATFSQSKPGECEFYAVWTESIQVIPPGRAIKLIASVIPDVPLYCVDSGKPDSSPYLIQREGIKIFGSHAYQTADFHPQSLRYRFPGLNPNKRYRLGATYYFEKPGETWRMRLKVDGRDGMRTRILSGERMDDSNWVPASVYQDGVIDVEITPDAGDFALCNEIALYEFNRGSGGSQTDEAGPIAVLPLTYALGQSFPNPFKDNATIAYQLPEETPVSLKVFNVTGQVVRELASGKQKAGFYNAVWDGKDGSGRSVSSGVYFYRLDAGGFSKTNKLVVVR